MRLMNTIFKQVICWNCKLWVEIISLTGLTWKEKCFSIYYRKAAHTTEWVSKKREFYPKIIKVKRRLHSWRNTLHRKSRMGWGVELVGRIKSLVFVFGDPNKSSNLQANTNNNDSKLHHNRPVTFGAIICLWMIACISTPLSQTLQHRNGSCRVYGCMKLMPPYP